MTDLTFNQIGSLVPNVSNIKDQYRGAIKAANVNQILSKYGINDTPLRLSHFIAQIFAETGALSTLIESLNYSSAKRLTAVWPKRFPTIAAAQPYVNNPQKLGDFVYGGRMGNSEPGDGFRYRGRGLLQITGRDAYTRYCGELHFDLVGDPDLAFDPSHCLEVAAAEWAASGWHGKSCNELADDDNIIGVTYAINGGQNGIEDRRFWLAKAKVIWLKPPITEPQLASRATANLALSDLDVQLEATPTVAAPAVELGVANRFDPKQASLLGQFVAAAYAMYQADPTNLAPSQSPDFPAGYRLLASVQMRDFILLSTDPVFYGFVAQSIAEPNRFVLAIRGTSNLIEWWDDANAGVLEPFKTPECGSVASGFARIYDTLEVVEYPTPGVTAAAAPRSLKSEGGFSQQIASLVRRRSVLKLTTEGLPAAAALSVTGHSLGGALATLYALDNAKTDQVHSPLVCTFASPRVGDSTFAAAFNGLALTSWRIANAPDLVPNFPPELLGFKHVDALQAVSSTGKVKSTIACWHSLATYLSLIDPAWQPDAACQLVAPATAAAIRGAPFVGRAATITTPSAAGGPITINITVNVGESE
jgi:putative chitinase